jgi:nucleoside-diphosphate-sugar epimerase
MKILIVGGGGFIGSFVERELCSLGEVYILERPQSTLDKKNVIKADICELDSLRKAYEGFDIIVHLAGVFDKDDYKPSNQEMFDINIKGVFNSLQASVENKIKKFVLASSICAFGTEIDKIPATEKDIPKPGGKCSEFYGMTKRVDEVLCEGYTNIYGVPTICLRLAVVKRPEMLESVPARLSKNTLWCYVDVRDVALAFRLACENNTVKHDIFFISAEDTFAPSTNRELIKQLEWFKEENVDPQFDINGNESFFSIKKAKELLGYRPQHTWRKR